MQLRVPASTVIPCILAFAAPSEGDWRLQPPFSVAPAVLLQESQRHKPKDGQSALELYEETVIRLDPQGRRETRNRYVFRVDHESAIESWRSIGAVWAPWRQERPILRARVVTPDGESHSLDPGTIGEFPFNEEGPKNFDDRKRLVAPLPKLSVGSLAEVEVVIRDTAPIHKVGTLGWISLYQDVPVLQTRAVVDLPESMPFEWMIEGLGPIRPLKSKENGRIRLTVELGSTEPPEDREPASDPEANRMPTLAFTTVPSWASAAASYAEIVERQLVGADLSAWAKQAIGETSDPKEKINRLLDKLGQSVRYTGIEFGKASIVPWTPAEVLQRGFGDCKDKATLLVGLLRAVGIQAHVALLETGPGKDVNPDLPGLNGFDHAIVFVPGPSPLWIDPTTEYARVGDLPFCDQGRWALVADPKTNVLLRTPAASSLENMTLETREIFLAEAGKARVVETSHPSGLAEMRLRNGFSPTDPKKLRENLKKYVQNEYSAEDLGEYTVGDPSVLGRPFTVRLEALGCNQAFTYDVDASVILNAWGMSRGLRNLVPTSFDRKDKEPVQPRKQDLVFHEPYSIEWRYRIVPPVGFEARPLPPSDRLAFGPASLTRTFERNSEGQILATFRFDTGKARWTASEVEAARSAMESFGNSAPTRILFDQVGEAHLAAGRIKEAIQTFRAQSNEQPTRGVPLSRLAIALLRGGMGEAARDAARKACQLEPKSMFVNRTLGWVMQHDLVNRIYHKGWDQVGALAAYRKAKELDPKDALTRKNLAILLEHNVEGIRYGAGADLDAAIKEYRALRKDLQVEDMNHSMLIALWRAGRYRELEESVKGLPASNDAYGLLLAAMTINRGSQASLKEASSVIPNQGQRREALLAAGDLLVSVRRYPEAVALLAAGADGASNAPVIRGRIALLAKTRRIEDLSWDGKNPATVIWRLMKTLVDESSSDKDILRYFTPALLATAGSSNDLKEFRKVFGFATVKRDGSGVPPAVNLDVVLAMSQVVVEGDEATGYRIRLQMPETESKDEGWYVVREAGKFLIAAMDMAPSSLGVEALRRLEIGDSSGARSILDRAREHAWAGNADEPLSGDPFCRFWKKGQVASAEDIRAAAASLMATDKDCRQAVPLLEAGRAKAKDAQALERFDIALLSAHMTRKEWVPLEPVSERMAQAHPTSKRAAWARAATLRGTKKWGELLQLTEQLLVNDPYDPGYLAYKWAALRWLGRNRESDTLLESLVVNGKASALEFNNLAWSHLTHGRVTNDSLELARRSVLLNAKDSGAAQHTLASLLAERGEATEALEIFFKELSDLEEGELRGQDWYLIGRIAELFGERDAAASSYRRVPPPGDDEVKEDSCHALAARRLKVLGKS